jgi:hypothetical protein
MIVNYRGRIVGEQAYGGCATFVSGPIDVAALRKHRCTSQWTNWMKDIRAEMAQLIYEKPIYPKNLYLDREPMRHAEYAEKVIKPQIQLMRDRGIWK